MREKKFEFTVKEKDEIELMFDTDCLLSDVFDHGFEKGKQEVYNKLTENK